ncbi:MAG: hypothetical protein HC915_15720 [Anaerolineae bacterium]|nr:hypothetical protein [Anaerolineae bacterium]
MKRWTNGFFVPDALARLALNERSRMRVQDALSGTVALQSYPFNRREFAHLRRRFALRYVQNLLAGRPEPRYPRFDAQAVAVVSRDDGQVLVSEGQRLPGVVLDGSLAPWDALAASLNARFGLTSTLHWRGLWQDTDRDRITFVFGAPPDASVSGDFAAVHDLTAHHTDLVQRTREQDGIWWI